MIRYLDTFKDHFGVEAICHILRATECGFLTARGYRAAKTRPGSVGALSDQMLGGEMLRLHAETAMSISFGPIGAIQARPTSSTTGCQGQLKLDPPVSLPEDQDSDGGCRCARQSSAHGTS